MNVFRPAPERSPRANLLRTAGMTALFWFTFVVLGPALLLSAERRLGVPGFPGHVGAGVAIAVAMGALNLWAGWAMAIVGRGTPLPTETARLLVVAGPYRFVRNPMAIGGLGVAVGLGVAFGAWGLLVYALLGGVIWQLVARPMEERDLEARFGDPYRAYVAAVGCWVPRIPGYTGARGGP